MLAKLRAIFALVVLLALATSLVTVTATPSSAETYGCVKQDYFPTRGAVKTIAKTSGSSKVFGVRLEFSMDQGQINRLKCWATHLEIDFHITGFALPPQWEGYDVHSNLPGAVHDVAASDFLELTPAVTGIQTGRIEPGKTYYATLTWSAPLVDTPRVEVRWVPSYWAVNGPKPYESMLCHLHNFYPGWCVFGYDGGKDPYLLSQSWFKDANANWGWIPFRIDAGIQIFDHWGSAQPELSNNPDNDLSASNLLAIPAIMETPPPPRILQVKRTQGPDGARQVYAATKTAVTESYWHPGEDGPKTSEIIHISQGNIVGFDKVTQPDGVTQSLYTAVSDGVWESYWRPGEGIRHNKIVTGLSGVRQIVADNVWENGQYVHRLYVLASDGPYEVYWKDGGDGVHVNRLDAIAGAVSMTKSKGPDGTDQLYVATPTWVYELWWRSDTGVHHSPLVNITQGNIVSLSKADNSPDGKQRLYTGTTTDVWESSWGDGAGLSHRQLVVNQSNALQVKKAANSGVDQLYLVTGDHAQEYWWNGGGGSSGNSQLIHISQNNITSFDKSSDGAYQQLYTATANGDVWETYWGGGQGPTSKVLFSVAR